MPTMLQVTVPVHGWSGQTVPVPMSQLVQWKHAIASEIEGTRHSRGSVRAHVRRVLSTPASYSDRELHGYIANAIAYVERTLNGL